MSTGAVTADQNYGSAGNVIDGSFLTYWSAGVSNPPSGQDWGIDMGAPVTITRIKTKIDGFFFGAPAGGFMFVNASANGIDWSSIHQFNGPGESEYTIPSPESYRYFRLIPNLSGCTPADCSMNIYEFELYGGDAAGIHTTASTQIDGGANFWQWETFTDSKTTPANTSVIYRYRTSANGTDWTSWVGSIGAVTSRTGDDSNNPTKYRYLQIEATLSNTDGVSTPTIDSYSIGYHTNQPPNKPSAMTAVIN